MKASEGERGNQGEIAFLAGRTVLLTGSSIPWNSCLRKAAAKWMYSQTGSARIILLGPSGKWDCRPVVLSLGIPKLDQSLGSYRERGAKNGPCLTELAAWQWRQMVQEREPLLQDFVQWKPTQRATGPFPWLCTSQHDQNIPGSQHTVTLRGIFCQRGGWTLKPDILPVLYHTDLIKGFLCGQFRECSGLVLPWDGSVEMRQAEGSTRQNFSQIILGTCYITKEIQIGKTDHGF